MHASGRLAAAVGLSVFLAGCPSPRSVPAPTPPDIGRVSALLVNGGGTPASNYWSHLNHVRGMRQVLLDAGVAPSRISILAGDGDAPGGDLALRMSRRDQDGWLLGGGKYDRSLRARVEQTSSKIDGATMEPADRSGLERWFADSGSRLVAGDTLLLFVTDHGTKNKDDLTDNHITLWGQQERISVRELRALLDAHLDPGVRVVSIMSQCYSGSFAHLADLDPDVPPARPVCGYFSTTPERQAYGCYPEARRKDDTGHAVQITRALTVLGALPTAHDAALVWDDTPDVPLRTSDVFLERELTRGADATETSFTAFVDRELQQALIDAGRWEPELRLLDDIAAHYGLFSPRRLAEVETHTEALTGLAKRFRTHRKVWRTTRASAGDANVERWLATDADAKARIAPSEANALDRDGRAALRSDVISSLSSFTKRDAGTWDRLARLRDTTAAAEAVTYRTEVRLGVLLRLRQLLVRIAGRSYVERAGSDAAQARLAALTSCETFTLGPTILARRDVAAPRSALPSFEDDQRLATSFLPSWLGIAFRPPPPGLATMNDLPPGAAFVTNVYPGSPAAEAELQRGDIVVGPPGAPFMEPTQVREWTMYHPRSEPATLRYVRAGELRDTRLQLREFPSAFPKLPEPPSAGTAAPALRLSSYRGAPPTGLATGRKTLLYFWATWCGYCKAALPELEKLAQRSSIDLVAITDEQPQILDTYFEQHAGFFPGTVAIDLARTSFLDYGVNGMPTFVLVDGDGRISSRHVGYSAKRGLPF